MQTLEEKLLQNDEDSKTDLEELVIQQQYELELLKLGIEV